MTGAVLDRPLLMPDRPALDGGGSLEELLSSALSEARANGSTECPVCHAAMSAMGFTRAGAREAGNASAPHAECSGCGSRLS
jgi:hypothetical protein